jgi:hypothetical protein
MRRQGRLDAADVEFTTSVIVPMKNYAGYFNDCERASEITTTTQTATSHTKLITA